MKMKELLQTTDNSSIYNKVLKRFRESKGDIRCSVCPYHKCENDNGKRYLKNWKRYRRTQYKVKT